ncbi:MAG TPA: mechanosensitive ion channel [Gemmatimonadaceae bacterium]|nr:mechanosensitive ion channel [Gemmatimonadaceae bacterium]
MRRIGRHAVVRDPRTVRVAHPGRVLIVDFAIRLRESFLQLLQYLPALIGALVIVFAGYLLAKLIERATDRVLARLGLNRWLERGGVLEAVERTGWRQAPSRIFAAIVFWLVMFVVILVAANALGLSALAEVFQQLVSYVPSVIAALVIVLVGIVLGEFVDGLIMASAGGIPGGPTLARVGRAGVVILAIFMALQTLGVATDIVTTAFAIIFGAVAFGAALAFGLGNRELAGEITRAWYERVREQREAIAREVEARRAREETEAIVAAARGSRSSSGGHQPDAEPPASESRAGETRGDA